MIWKITHKILQLKYKTNDEDDKGPTILKSEIVKAIKDMRRKKSHRRRQHTSRFIQGTGRQWIEKNDCTG